MLLINCLLGLSSHSGKHACPYCEGEMTLTLGVLRTFRSLQFWHQKLMEDAGQSRNPEDFIKKNQKNYMNVVNESMLTSLDQNKLFVSESLSPLTQLANGYKEPTVQFSEL